MLAASLWNWSNTSEGKVLICTVSRAEDTVRNFSHASVLIVLFYRGLGIDITIDFKPLIFHCSNIFREGLIHHDDRS